jgi:hypothetical protein
MTLPHETEVAGEIAVKHRVQLEAMTKQHDTVVAMMSAGSWTVRNTRGLNPVVAQTMIGLLAKASKTFRSIQLLCERGLHEDANALVRVLMETTVAIAFILQKKSKERALIYHAHGIAQSIKMLNEWKNTRGLKRKATTAILKQANDGLNSYLKRLPPGTDVKRHWSGKSSLHEAVRALRGDVMYATLYRFTSSISHAADFGAHFEVDTDSDDLIWEIEPQVRGFEAPSYAARELLWNASNRIDQRLGLGYADALAPHKLTSSDVRNGQK